MTYNSALLNGDVLGAGSDASRYVSPVGSVLVEGTVGLVMQRGLYGVATGYATTDASMVSRIRLAGDISARAVNASGNVDTSVKPLYASCTASAQSDPRIGLKMFMQSSRAASALPYSVPQVKRALSSSVIAKAICEADNAGRATLTSVVQAKALSNAKFKLNIGMRSDTTASATSVAIPHLAMLRLLSATGVGAATSSSRLFAEESMRSTQGALATTDASLLSKKQLIGLQVAEAVPVGVMVQALTLRSDTPAQVVSHVVMLTAYRMLYGTLLCRAVTYAAIEERDFKPAPEERVIVVPSEDRKMMVS